MSAPVVKEYAFGWSKRRAILFFLGMLPGSALILFLGFIFDRPINVAGTWLAPSRARVLFQLISPLILVALMAASAQMYMAFARRRTVVLTESHLSVPYGLGLSRKEISIPLRDIKAMTLQPIMGCRLRLDYADGKIMYLFSEMFQTRSLFEEFCQDVFEAAQKVAQEPRA